jgi:tetratricopeptide (TPR) repeat protein
MKLPKTFYALFLIIILFVLLDSFLAADSLSVKDLFKKSYNLYQDKKYEEAIVVSNQILESNPKFYPAYNIIGLCKTNQKRNVLDAVFYFEKSLAITPKQPQIYNFISVLYNELGMREKGFSYIKKGLKHNPNNFLLIYNAGLTSLLVKRNPYVALDFFQKAEQINSGHQRLLYLLGISYLFSNQKEMVLDMITRLRKDGSREFAWKLEELIRKSEEGEKIDLGGAMKFYSQQPREGKSKIENEKKQEKIETSQPETKLKGKGTIYIKQKFQKK